MEFKTAQVFDAALALADQLATLDYPTVNGVPVTVSFGEPIDHPARSVSVITRPETPSRMEWRDSRPKRTEAFVLRVGVTSNATHIDARTAWEDLRDICAVIESGIRSTTTGLPLSWMKDALGVDVMVDTTAVGGIDPRVYPHDTGGWGAQASIDIPFECRI